jgi:hypothetical protein
MTCVTPDRSQVPESHVSPERWHLTRRTRTSVTLCFCAHLMTAWRPEPVEVGADEGRPGTAVKRRSYVSKWYHSAQGCCCSFRDVNNTSFRGNPILYRKVMLSETPVWLA